MEPAVDFQGLGPGQVMLTLKQFLAAISGHYVLASQCGAVSKHYTPIS